MPVKTCPGASHIWPSKDTVDRDLSSKEGFSSAMSPERVADIVQVFENTESGRKVYFTVVASRQIQFDT